ncbi:MAG: hypothetical protein JWQ36_257 [Enterovirga sp.]|nr:hypothetical protein [Enterovirga sp.]
MTDATPPSPTLDDAGAAAIVDAMAPLLGLSIDPAWRGEVAMNLVVIANAARLVLDFPLPDELEPAPVFRA